MHVSGGGNRRVHRFVTVQDYANCYEEQINFRHPTGRAGSPEPATSCWDSVSCERRDPDRGSPVPAAGSGLVKDALPSVPECANTQIKNPVFFPQLRSRTNMKTAFCHPGPRAKSMRSGHHVSDPEIQTSFKVASKVSRAPLCIPTTGGRAEPSRAAPRRLWRLQRGSCLRFSAPASLAAPGDDISSKKHVKARRQDIVVARALTHTLNARVCASSPEHRVPMQGGRCC